MLLSIYWDLKLVFEVQDLFWAPLLLDFWMVCREHDFCHSERLYSQIDDFLSRTVSKHTASIPLVTPAIIFEL